MFGNPFLVNSATATTKGLAIIWKAFFSRINAPQKLTDRRIYSAGRLSSRWSRYIGSSSISSCPLFLVLFPRLIDYAYICTCTCTSSFSIRFQGVPDSLSFLAIVVVMVGIALATPSIGVCIVPMNKVRQLSADVLGLLGRVFRAQR